jgi:probable phosphoglycerate mutase
MSTRICFVRHGETAWNAERRIQGQLDIPLNANGVAQARALAGVLRDEAFAAIYASDLARALHTAQALAHRLHLPVARRTGLRERHFGLFQGLTAADCRARHPAEHARLQAREPDYVPAGGESLLAFAGRTLACLDVIVAAHPGAQVLVATHGGVLDLVHRRATGRPLDAPRDFDLPNCALNWIEIGPGGWSILAWADRGHLAAALDELAAQAALER